MTGLCSSAGHIIFARQSEDDAGSLRHEGFGSAVVDASPKVLARAFAVTLNC